MADAGVGTKRKPKKWYHLHFYTIVALTVTATVLGRANMSLRVLGDCFETMTWSTARGWPAYAAGHWWEGQGRFVPEDAQLEVSPFGIVVDLVVGLSILALVAFVCEWKARSPRAKWLYLHRPTGLIVLLLAEALLLVNLYHINSLPIKRGSTVYDYSRGWPRAFGAERAPGDERSYRHLYRWAARDNVLFALFVLAAVALLCELGIRAGKRVRAGPPPGEGKVGAQQALNEHGPPAGRTRQ